MKIFMKQIEEKDSHYLNVIKLMTLCGKNLLGTY